MMLISGSQIPAAAATLARAFHNDPLMIYAIHDPAERRRLLPDVYTRMIRFGVLTGEVFVTAGAIEGVALWLPPDAKWTRENIEASGMHETATLIGNDAYQRYREVVGPEWHARERDMTGACWYLLLLGVEPNCQRRGLGTALVRPILESLKDRLDARLPEEDRGIFAVLIEIGIEDALVHQVALPLNGEDHPDPRNGEIPKGVSPENIFPCTKV